ncbi:MAG: thioredoxin domain-containing protein [marine benthic group bacterium]|nr:thioredoxin domain-containing protein [Gemmatimonadota bacterium]
MQIRTRTQNSTRSRSVPNRLAEEKSPYLLQHAENPVDWYPWGDEAFAAARELDRPIFLSIGYATCHWCHVMEHESFEDEEVARLMNETFVNVKVDREERPDIDGIYMSVAQLMGGQGGWPLTIVMTPERLPFFSGTYFPRESRFGRPGMVDLVPRIGHLWSTRREDLSASADAVRANLEKLESGVPSGRAPGPDTLNRGFEELTREHDSMHGGFGRAPKFPTPHRLLFLLRYWRRTGNARALEIVERTLDAMRAGGVFDQVGFGFHRYSTDAGWLLPHFEKMLYDQALLTMACVEAYQVTGAERHARVAREVIEYVLRDLTDPTGGFHSAEDADSEGEEGRFYVWTEAELREVVGGENADLAVTVWGVRPEGNFTDEATGLRTGANIPHLPVPAETLAASIGMESTELLARLETSRRRLFERRKERIRPLKDDKVLTDWNGLMIAALAKASVALDEPRYLSAAERAADFLWSVMWQEGRLLHRYRKGDAEIDGNLDDYAFLAWAEIELHQASQDLRHLERARRLTDAMLDLFGDGPEDGLYFAPSGREDLIVRRREVYDGAIPSGNSAALSNLLRLARLTAEPRYEREADAIAKAFGAVVEAHPAAFTWFLSGLEFVADGGRELVIAGDPDSGEAEEMLRTSRRGYRPHLVTILRPAAMPGARPSDGSDAGSIAPFLAEFEPESSSGATAWLCRGLMCERPVTRASDLADLLEIEA